MFLERFAKPSQRKWVSFNVCIVKCKVDRREKQFLIRGSRMWTHAWAMCSDNAYLVTDVKECRSCLEVWLLLHVV